MCVCLLGQFRQIYPSDATDLPDLLEEDEVVVGVIYLKIPGTEHLCGSRMFVLGREKLDRNPESKYDLFYAIPESEVERIESRPQPKTGTC